MGCWYGLLLILIERAGSDEGPDLFEEAVKADLQKIYSTPTGRKLLDSLHASGKPTTIQYALDGLNRAFIPKGTTTHLYQADGTPGEGVAITLGYNPGLDTIGKEAWSSRPPAIALAHELIHAEQAAHGRMRRGSATNPGAVNKMNPLQPAIAPVVELETVGVPPHDEYHVSENKIRAEWTPPQPNRDRY
ncbi:hypothetical protein J4E00_17860 [Siccationidurans soli]|uniref:Tox-MPTase4 domain-containing protein n=1 Tax=Hymenobacter negativus TaxID=2795026 RepID=A0ABS3QI65_9BACT|nr:hypothetical protein [Hymenobacter negativus]